MYSLQTYQSADLFLSVGGRARRGLNHGGRLVVRQLLDAALAGHDVTDLKRGSNTPPWRLRGIAQTLRTDTVDEKVERKGTSPPSHLQGKVGVLLFLAHLQAWQVRILEL